MKNKFISYSIFILAMALFLFVRIYAGNNLPSISDSPAKNPSDSTESINPVTFTPTPSVTDEDVTEDIIDSEDHGLLNDPWHGDFTPVKSFSGELPRIICWGDSLTATVDNKTAYPDVLRELSGCEVINYGVEAESASMIAMREGGVPVTVGATVIPSSTELIPIFLKSENGDTVFFLDHGDEGINPCIIDGIEGELTKLNGAYYFKRAEKGERKSIESETTFITHGMNDSNPEDILIIFSGTNDMPDRQSVYDIIDIIHNMITAADCNKYIVIGLTYAGGMSDIDKVNEILANEFEDNFLDIRSYLLNFGLEDAKITPTAKDMINISEGEIPDSLRADYVHGNKHFYRLLAQQIYRRLQYLGYLPID